MDAAVETESLTKHYPMGQTVVRALDGVSLSVARGEFLGLLGASGSGKSTLLNLIAGLDRPTSGSVKVFDRNLTILSRSELSLHRRKNVGMIFQSFNLIPTMTAGENVALAMMFAGVPRADREARARTLLEQVGLGGRQRHRPKELSGGEQQRVAIARALVNKPALILADEPTGNLDSERSAEVLALLRSFNRDHGQTIVLVTHDQEVGDACDRIVRMRDGLVHGEEIVRELAVA